MNEATPFQLIKSTKAAAAFDSLLSQPALSEKMLNAPEVATALKRVRGVAADERGRAMEIV